MGQGGILSENNAQCWKVVSHKMLYTNQNSVSLTRNIPSLKVNRNLNWDMEKHLEKNK